MELNHESNSSIDDSGASLLMDIKTDNDPEDSLSVGSQMPFSKMVDNALLVTNYIFVMILMIRR